MAGAGAGRGAGLAAAGAGAGLAGAGAALGAAGAGLGAEGAVFTTAGWLTAAGCPGALGVWLSSEVMSSPGCPTMAMGAPTATLPPAGTMILSSVPSS